jgi:hypothetical protein
MEQRAGDSRRADLRSSCALICSGLKMKGLSFHVNFMRGWARREKFLMKIQTTPTVPRNVRTSERDWHGPHFRIAETLDSSGSRPSGVHL